MNQIRVLPDILANKIAAGEVVERPASVIKELVENAIDAKSTRISISIEQGGRKMIRVADNGIGMNTDDAVLAVERYATSKIKTDDDLFAIQTLGFRGEALPSIASVSRFQVITREASHDIGTSLSISGGKLSDVSEVGAAPGTMVTVRDLFFNTPARRKFLKTVNTEMGHITDTVASIALGWPDIQFSLSHNDRVIKQWSRVDDPIDRVLDVLGRDLKNTMAYVEHDSDDMTLSGWVSEPSVSRSTSQRIYAYVNGRYVRERGLMHALIDGYRGRLMKGRFPLAVLFIDVPGDQVDVNVHPTKHEVRFVNHRSVYTAVQRSVITALDASGRTIIPQGSFVPARFPGAKTVSLTPVQHSLPIKQAVPVLEKDQGINISEVSAEFVPEEKNAPLSNLGDLIIYDTPGDVDNQSAEDGAPKSVSVDSFMAGLRVIGQLHRSYILCESLEGLVLVDQHAAHERIVYESLKERKGILGGAAQRLLIPETFTLGAREADLFEQLIPELEQMGIEVSSFGPNAFAVKSVPGVMAEKALIPMMTEVAEKMVEIGYTPGVSAALDECRVVMACHSAIRANQPLTPIEMKSLLIQLAKCSNPAQCPHGRPAWLPVSLSELEKMFKRTV